VVANSIETLSSGRDAKALNALIVHLGTIESALRAEWEGKKEFTRSGDCPKDIEVYWRRVLVVRHALCLVQQGKVPSRSFWCPSKTAARLLLIRGKSLEVVALGLEDEKAVEAEDLGRRPEEISSAFSLIETVREAEALIQLFQARQGDKQSFDTTRSKYKLPRLKGRARGRPRTGIPSLCGIPEFQRVLWEFFEQCEETMSLTAQAKEILARLSRIERFHKCLPSLTDVCNAIKCFDVKTFQLMRK
jgi:hypothetical protein